MSALQVQGMSLLGQKPYNKFIECAWLQRAAPQRAPHSLTFLTLKALGKSTAFSDIFGSTFISFVLVISLPVGK